MPENVQDHKVKLLQLRTDAKTTITQHMNNELQRHRERKSKGK